MIYNVGKNFVSIKFKLNAKSIDIEITKVLVEVYNNVRKVERYYAPLRKVYQIFKDELSDISNEAILQMAVKIINDSARPDDIILYLLVFRVYLRISSKDLLLSIIIKRVKAIRLAIKEI